MSASTKDVGLVVTSAPLLSGTLRDCAAVSATTTATDNIDGRCSSGGVAAVQAYVRYYNSLSLENQNNEDVQDQQRREDIPALVIPMGDFKSALTEMSRFHFGVNVMIYANVLHWRTWTAPAYTLWQNRLDPHTVVDAQEPSFPVLISNYMTNPTEDWYQYIKSIHFDTETQMAMIYITKDYVDNALPQVETVMKLVQYVYKYNASNKCQTPYAASIASPQTVFQNRSFSEWWMEHSDEVLANHEEHLLGREAEGLTTAIDHHDAWSSLIDFESWPDQQYDPNNCFVPVVVFDDESDEKFHAFIDAFNATNVNVTYPPQLIIDIYGQILDDNGNPTIQTLETGNEVTPTWLVSYKASSDKFDQVRFTLSPYRTSITDVTLIHDDLLNLAEQVKTPEYYDDLMNIRQYAHEAWATSLVSERGVESLRMNEQTDPTDGYRHCYTRECEMGNLVADGLRWIEGADVALLPSFMFNGPGWEEGEVRTLEILENIPYSTSRCSGTMTGHSLLRLINHSIATSSFGGFDSTKTGGRLLQVSGMKVVFNNIIDGGNKIISIDIWDEQKSAFAPLIRTQLYRFVSCGHLCFTFVDYPPFLGEYLTEDGEIPAIQSSESDIKDDLREYLSSQYLSTDTLLVPRLEERLLNDISQFDVLPVVTKDDCTDGVSFWSSELMDCELCPTYDRVVFSKSSVKLQGDAFSSDLLKERVVITNEETFPVDISADMVALPDNIQVSVVASKCEARLNNETGVTSCVLHPNEQLVTKISFDPSNRHAGRDTSSVVFTINDDGRSPGCATFKGKYDIVADLNISRDSNRLGGVASFGYTCAAIIILTAIVFGCWVRIKRRTRLVSTMQPFFLITLCFGVLLLGAGLIPLSIDDGLASDEGCSLSCIFRPWLLSVGFTLCVAALFSKLWRINKLFGLRQFRRLEIHEKDVLLPTTILFVLNIIFNLVWTFVEPLQWERVAVEGQPWNSYGRCHLGEGNVGIAMLSCIATLCIIGFIMTCLQAFRARNISSEFSEAKYLGIAVFSWVQIAVVGVPVLFLVDEDNVVARYSLIVGFIFTTCMSMLLVVFVPMFLFKQQRQRESYTSSMRFRNSQQKSSYSDFISPFRKERPFGSIRSSKNGSKEIHPNIQNDEQVDSADIEQSDSLDDVVDKSSNSMGPKSGLKDLIRWNIPNDERLDSADIEENEQNLPDDAAISAAIAAGHENEIENDDIGRKGIKDEETNKTSYPD